MDITLWSRCFSSISGFDSDSRAHFRSESVQRLINYNKIEYFVHRSRVVNFKWKSSFMYLNWTYPYDSDVFLQFRVLIRILEPNSVSNQSRDSFILIKLKTLSTGEELLTSGIGWDSNQSRDSFILIKLKTLSTGEELLTSRGNRVLSILIGDNFMKQMFSSISGIGWDSRAHFSSESVQRLINYN